MKITPCEEAFGAQDVLSLGILPVVSTCKAEGPSTPNPLKANTARGTSTSIIFTGMKITLLASQAYQEEPHRVHSNPQRQPGEAVESTLRMLKSGGTCRDFRSPCTATQRRSCSPHPKPTIIGIPVIRLVVAAALTLTTPHSLHYTTVQYQTQ